MNKSLEERVTNLERRTAILGAQIIQSMELTQQIADHLLALAEALNVPLKEETDDKEKMGE